MGTSLERSESQVNLTFKAECYKVKAKRVYAMSVQQLFEHSRLAIDYVRQQKRPFFLECDTYRFRAHSMFDPEEYRSKEEVEKWKHNDPITLFIHQLQKHGWINQNDIQTMRTEIEKRLDEAIQFAEESEYEEIDDCLKEVI